MMHSKTKRPGTKQASTSKGFEEAQSLIRGAIARHKKVSGQKIFSEKKRRRPVIEIDPDAELRRNIQLALAQSRRRLSPTEYGQFFSYYSASIAATRVSGKGAGDDFLQGYFEIPVLSLVDELQWVVERLNHEQLAIQTHLSHLSDMDSAAMAGRYVTARKQLSLSVEEVGQSLWSSQLAIALENQIGGLEAQKRLYEAIRRRNRKGMLALVSYYTSIRNEGRSTLQRFRDDTRIKLSKIKPRPLSIYLSHKLLGEWPTNESDIADVLRVEQCHSIVDLYETFVSLLQEVVRNEELAWLSEAIAPHVSQIVVSDFRLDKVRLQLGLDGVAMLPVRSTAASDALFEGRPKEAMLCARQERNDIWNLIYQAAAGGQSKNVRTEGNVSLRRRLAIVFAELSDSPLTRADLEKLCFNLGALPSHRGISDFVDQLSLPRADRRAYRFSLASLNAQYVGPEDFGSSVGTPNRHSASFDKTSTLAFWTNQTSPKVVPSLNAFGLGASLESNGRLPEARAVLLQDVVRFESRFVGTLSAALLLRILTALGDRHAIIGLVADVVSQSRLDQNFARIQEALAIVEFQDIKSFGNSLEPLIALHVQQRLREDEKIRSQLRYATKNFLRNSEFKKPSQISIGDGRQKAEHIIYFLREICIPSILDVTGIFRSSSEVLEERQEICGLLNSIDPGRGDDYRSEMLSLEHNRKISQGLRIVNKNRVHVDTDLIARSFARGSSEEFNRYIDLQRAGIGISDDYDEVLRAILSANRQSRLPVFNPDNEADATLALLVSRARDEFLNNSVGGLDFFLSKRIRHQSFVGLVRGPLEFERLITTKETASSDYRENEYWLSQFSDISEDRRITIEAAFRRFSVQFDTAILEVKDRSFHVRSSEQPDGIFDVPLVSSTLALIRAIMHDIQSAEDFARTMCVIFWALVEGSLQAARAIIQDRLKMRVASLFDELRVTVTKEASDAASLPAFSLAIGRASNEVQQALSDAQAWFKRPETEQAVQLFSLEEALDIAIESAKKLNRAFDPILERTIVGKLRLQAADLVFITDAVFIAFSNIRAYCGLKQPVVTVGCVVDEGAGTLTVTVVNEVASKVRTSEQERRLDAIRAQIVDGTAGRLVRKEGGTGFLKLGNVVSQSQKGAISFGYRDDTHFQLEVTWSLLIDRQETEDVAENPAS